MTDPRPAELAAVLDAVGAAVPEGWFLCDFCGGIFEKSPPGVAEAEAAERFPDLDITDPQEAAMVCDDCYEILA